MKRIVCFFLCIVLLLSLLAGCQGQEGAYVPTGDGLTWDEGYTGPTQTQPEQVTEQELMLTYYPSRSTNPYQSTDFTNRTLFSLLYQSLFVVDREYNIEPQLCSRYGVSEDMKTYRFYVDPQATFSDGSRVTGQDVADSLLMAKDSVYYSGRFRYISGISVAEDGAVTVRTRIPMENLPQLLDIPIVRSDQVQENRPLGTGPYYYDNTAMNLCLRRRTDWWCSAEMIVTAPTIALVEAESAAQIRDQFQFEDLSLVCADPGSDRYADYMCDFELWDCENAIFLYLSCCMESPIFSNATVRQALTYAIDREMLAESYYRGFARAASLPASPLFPYYNNNLASKYAYAPAKFAQALSDAGFSGRTVRLLVNKDDSLRLRVAREIAKELEACGLKVTLLEEDSKGYRNVLAWREYDLYLGQTKLSPNMDLSDFFTRDGETCWGGNSNVATFSLCQQALENHGNYYTLHQEIMERGLICPILFRSYAVYATRGLVTNLSPARDNIFYYNLGKSMEDARAN